MASLGHVAVGMAAARVWNRGAKPSWGAMAGWSALSLLPDTDVIGFSMGVEYGDPWGHRGASHSIAFALGVAGLVTLLARVRRMPPLRTFIVAACVLGSHGLLDTLTDGGLGAALFWPFDLTRYFAPWNPIPVAPIGLAFLTPEGLVVAAAELVLFAPLIAFASSRPRLDEPPWLTHRRALMAIVWLPLVWFVASSGPTRNAILGFLLREDVTFPPGYSEAAFNHISIGQSKAAVFDALGPPLAEGWVYEPESRTHACVFVYFRADVLRIARDTQACAEHAATPGATRASVRAELGRPSYMCWQYSRSPSQSTFRERAICFSGADAVDGVIRQWHPWYAPMPD